MNKHHTVHRIILLGALLGELAITHGIITLNTYFQKRSKLRWRVRLCELRGDPALELSVSMLTASRMDLGIPSIHPHKAFINLQDVQCLMLVLHVVDWKIINLLGIEAIIIQGKLALTVLIPN